MTPIPSGRHSTGYPETSSGATPSARMPPTRSFFSVGGSEYRLELTPCGDEPIPPEAEAVAWIVDHAVELIRWLFPAIPTSSVTSGTAEAGGGSAPSSSETRRSDPDADHWTGQKRSPTGSSGSSPTGTTPAAAPGGIPSAPPPGAPSRTEAWESPLSLMPSLPSSYSNPTPATADAPPSGPADPSGCSAAGGGTETAPSTPISTTPSPAPSFGLIQGVCTHHSCEISVTRLGSSGCQLECRLSDCGLYSTRCARSPASRCGRLDRNTP